MPERTAPSAAVPAREQRLNCPVAARCGGCQLTRMPYRQQLAHPQALVEKLLAPYCPVEPILGMTNPFHYRNKVHAALGVDKRGLPLSGVYAAGTHRIVPVKRCLIEDERASRIIQTIVELLPAFKLRVYNEYTGRGFLRHVLIRTGWHTGEILVVLVASSLEFPGKRAFVAELRQRHPEITSLVLNQNDRHTSMVLGRRETVLFGPGYLEDMLCGKRFRISPQSFYQVNAQQAEVLYQTAIELAGFTGEETVLDAYCGTGTIGLCASDHIRRLIGVELNPDAVRDARENAQRNSVANAEFICEDAGRFMTRLAKQKQAPDVVIMDPPRAGSDMPFLRSLLALAPKRVVYVSCNPETLARDVAVLCAGGYRAEKAVPVDMFPWTEHVETVVLLSKGEVDSKKIRVEFSLEDMDMSEFQDGATYPQIKAYVLEHSGLKVSNLYISQIKRKCGIEVGKNYNLPKSEDSRQPQCPPEKEKAIREAFKYFGMI